MFPILFRIPFLDFPIHGYGVLVASGFLIGSWVVQYNARREGEDPARAVDLVFYILLAAIFGSRVFYVLVSEPQSLWENPLYLFKIWEGGLVFYGGFIGAVGVSIWYFHKHHLPAWKYADFFAPALALGHGIGRLGCLLTGCCYGRAIGGETWYSLVFPIDPNSIAPGGIPLYPTQPMESLGELFLFAAMMGLLRRKKFDGQVITLYVMSYAVLRFVVEHFRGDTVRGFVFGGLMSTSQLIAIVLFLVAAGLYFFKRQGRTT